MNIVNLLVKTPRTSFVLPVADTWTVGQIAMLIRQRVGEQWTKVSILSTTKE